MFLTLVLGEEAKTHLGYRMRWSELNGHHESAVLNGQSNSAVLNEHNNSMELNEKRSCNDTLERRDDRADNELY